MKSLLVIFAMFLLTDTARANPRVLLTSFVPFGGQKRNTSIAIAQVAQKKLALQNIEVTTCILPVEFDAAAVKAKSCFENMNPKPDVVISLGAGGSNLKFEIMTHNVDNHPGLADNKGKIRIAQPIVAQGASPVAFRSFVMDLYCSQSPEKRIKTVISEFPGGYVCNNTSYHLINYFNQLQIPFTFIHVPDDGGQTKGVGKLEKYYGEELADMISALPLFKGSPTFESIFPFLPKSGVEIRAAQEILSQLPDQGRRACGLEFMQRLSERLN